MKRFAIALFVVVGTACGCSSKAPPPATQPAPPTTEGADTTPPGTETPTTGGSDTTPPDTDGPTTTPAQGSAVTGPGIGEKCGDGDACAPPTTCVKYYGIAGPRGPEFKSCEIKCDDDSKCPDGRKCVTVADGPGRVCR